MNSDNPYKLKPGNHCLSVILLLFLGLFFACAKKIYQKNDYAFYDNAFKLDTSSALRSDGVYVLNDIWTDENGGTAKPPK